MLCWVDYEGLSGVDFEITTTWGIGYSRVQHSAMARVGALSIAR